MQCDPIEKKPFFHAYPGALAYSFGMLGCDLHCGYCQNWVTSQALRDPNAISPPLQASPEALVQDALRQGAKSSGQHLQRTFNHQRMGGRSFQRGQSCWLITGFVSNGTARPRCSNICAHGWIFTKLISRALTIATITSSAGVSGPFSKPFAALHQMGLWLEIVTLADSGFQRFTTMNFIG